MARQKAICMTKDGKKVVINRDHRNWVAPSMDYCDFEGTFVFYSDVNFQVRRLMSMKDLVILNVMMKNLIADL